MKKNNRGFTLIEILAAVTILAIISGIAVAGVNKYVVSTKKKLYQNMEKSVCDAAKNYVMTESLDDEIKDSLEKGVTIEAKDLMKAKYLEDLVDPNNKSQNCRANVNIKLSDAAVDNDGLMEYVYYVKLRCKNYESNTGFSEGCAVSKKVVDPGSPEPSEDVDDPNTEPDVDTTKKPTCEIVKDNQSAEWVSGPVEVEVRCIDHSSKGCKQELYKKTYTEDIKTDYIEIEDNAGNKTKCKVNVYIDDNAPTKPILSSDYLDKWTNKSFSIVIDTYDKGSGLAYIEYRYPNSTSPGENSWKKYENSAKEPGDKTKFTTTKFSKERGEQVDFRACDNLGNCSEIVSTNIKIDKTAPSCTMSKNILNPDGLNNWYKTAVTISLNRNDPLGTSDRAVASPISYGMVTSNVETYNSKASIVQKDTIGVTWYGFIKDEAGNKASCDSGSFKVDTIKPDKPSITNQFNNKWVSKSYAISVVSKDVTSGIDYFAYRYPNSTVSGENQWKQYENSSRNPGDNTPFTTTKFSKERGEDVNIRACDLAGNCSDVSVSTIKIDKTAPTITPKYSLVTIGSISEENVADLFTIKYSKSSGSVKCNVSKTANIKASHNPLTCTVTGGSGLTASATIPIKNPLVSIAVTKNPNKMEYRLGDAFDKKGMVVTATYRDGTTKEVKDYTLLVEARDQDNRSRTVQKEYSLDNLAPGWGLGPGRKIIVFYNEDGVGVTTDFRIDVYLYTDQIVKYVVVPWKYQVHDISNRPTMWTEDQWFGDYEGYLYFDSSYKNNPYGCKYEIGSNYFKITSTNSSYLCRMSYEVFALAKDGSYWDAGYFEKDENYVFSRTSRAVHNTYGTMTWMSNIDNDGRADTSQNYTASIDTLRPRFDMGVACNRGTCTITHTMNSVTVSGKPVPIVTNDLDS